MDDATVRNDLPQGRNGSVRGQPTCAKGTNRLVVDVQQKLDGLQLRHLPRQPDPIQRHGEQEVDGQPKVPQGLAAARRSVLTQGLERRDQAGEPELLRSDARKHRPVTAQFRMDQGQAEIGDGGLGHDRHGFRRQ